MSWRVCVTTNSISDEWGRRRARAAAVAVLLVLPSCSSKPTRPVTFIDDVYERSTHALARAPEQAALCISSNASNAGYVASLQPLYGTSAVAVSVRTLPAGGNTLATVSLTSAVRGSHATVTTTRNGHDGNRKELLGALLKGC